jgi:hypothetical protein
MNWRASLKPVVFVVACVIWTVVGLTLIGPQIGEMFTYMTSLNPQQGLATLTCPGTLGQGEQGDVIAQFVNHSGKRLTYQTIFEIGSYASSEGSVGCDTTAQLEAGQRATATCRVRQMSDSDLAVRVTAWAQGENYHNSCDLGCPNSYYSICMIHADILITLVRPANLVVNGVVLVLGLMLAVLGTVWWLDAGRVGKAVIALFFILMTEFLALALGIAFGHWLPAAILNAAQGLAIFTTARQRRMRRDATAV